MSNKRAPSVKEITSNVLRMSFHYLTAIKFRLGKIHQQTELRKQRHS